MDGVVEINLVQFSLIYLLLLLVLGIMRFAKVDQSKMLILASVRMTVQLILAGLILTYIFQNPHPFFTVLYIIVMMIFSIARTLKRSPQINKKFKIAVALSIALSGSFVMLYFLGLVIGINVLNPQYAIPISGMVFGNAMTGVSLGLKTFMESMQSQRLRTTTMLNLGVSPQDILKPYVNGALETALLPTINSMMGLGIVSLPGMMTGQILAGTLPMTAIMYQISIMIIICTSVCLAVFASLNFGYRTLYNERNQIDIITSP